MPLEIWILVNYHEKCGDHNYHDRSHGCNEIKQL